MVECNLAKVDVASSSLVSRSKVWRVSKAVMQRIANSSSPVRLWNAPPSKICLCPSGEIGRHKGFKIPRNLYFRASSILASGTILLNHYLLLSIKAFRLFCSLCFILITKFEDDTVFLQVKGKHHSHFFIMKLELISAYCVLDE